MIRKISLIQVTFVAISVLPLSTVSELPTKIHIETPSDRRISFQADLTPVETFLANENLPIWVVEEANPGRLKRMSNIMKDLGPFTPYWDINTCSAALYFHKTSQLEGTLGVHYIMNKLKYVPNTDSVEPSKDTLYESFLETHRIKSIETSRPIVKNPSRRKYTVKSLLDYPEVVYVEVLVMVYYDITEDFNSDYSAVVTYILSLLNTVDMLYLKIQKPQIKINIAGIIIMSNKWSIPQFRKCHQRVREDDSTYETFALYTDCVTDTVRDRLKKSRVPFESFDIVLFITRSTLGEANLKRGEFYWHSEVESLFGIAFFPRPSEYRKKFDDIGVAIISDPTNFERFPTVAHEIAHLLGVPHDGGPLWNEEDGTCEAHLMKKDRSMCLKCLKFEGNTPSYFEKFFGARDGCIFRNEPRSLHPPGPRVFWGARDQCKCYGYPSNYQPQCRGSLMTTFDCNRLLKCHDAKGTITPTNFYMDGTPCQKDERDSKPHVCWDEECVPLQEDIELPQRMSKLQLSTNE